MGVKDQLTYLADRIRYYIDTDEKFSIEEMPDKVTEVSGRSFESGMEAGYYNGYDKGKADGVDEGYSEGYSVGLNNGFSEGKQAEYDAFWDSFQQNGTRKAYNYAFSRWYEACFKPKYDINVDGNSVGTIQGVFDTCNINRSLVDILNECGVSLKFVNCNNKGLYNTFSYSSFTEIDFVLENSATAKLNTTFYTCNNLKTARIIGLSETNTFNQIVDKCPSLENFTIEGTIGQNGLNFQYSTKLSKASIENIIGCLSTTASGLSVTLSKTAVNTAFGSTDSEEWLALINSRSNWTINLG